MAIVPGTIVETGQAITVNLPTARTSELPPFDELSDDDLFNAFDVSENKAKKLTASQLREKINGTATTTTPVVSGADMEIEIPETLIGEKRIDIPALAGLTYWLERIGAGRMWSTWFNTLSTGGFELTRTNDQFRINDKFVAHIYEYEGGSSSVPGAGGSSSFIKGIIPVTGDYTLATADVNKILNISAGIGKPVITLPDVADVEENAIVHLIAMVSNTYKATIQTTDGQYLYINGTSKLKAFVGPGEALRLYRGSDGWYCIDPAIGYTMVGRPVFGYAKPLNGLVADGQIIRRDSEPRLWEEVQSFGHSLVDKVTWDSSIDYQGCFHTGDGVDTFGLPDLRGTFPRFLNYGRTPILDTNGRTHDYAGGYAPDKVGPHTHGYNEPKLVSNSDDGGTPDYVGVQSGQTSINTGTGSGTENTAKSTALIGFICT